MPRKPGQGSLFERLEPDAPPRRTLTRPDLAAERIGAIKRHLGWLLNARQGCSSSSPELGLPDFNDAAIGSADLQLQVAQHIHRVVAAFEPRVRVVSVRPVADLAQSLELHFRLCCLVPLFNAFEQVEIDLVIHQHTGSSMVI